MKCMECEHMTVDDRHIVEEAGCSYGVPDGRWRFSIGYPDEDDMFDVIVQREDGTIFMTQVECDPRCPLKSGSGVDDAG